MQLAELRLSELNSGDFIISNRGFSCLPDGKKCLVQNYKGSLFVRCNQGVHFLDGQLAKDGDTVVGFSRTDP